MIGQGVPWVCMESEVYLYLRVTFTYSVQSTICYVSACGSALPQPRRESRLVSALRLGWFILLISGITTLHLDR